MNAPTITHVQLDCAGNWNVLMSNGVVIRWGQNAIDARLARYGLRLTMPDDVQPGWVGIPEPIPTPKPLPERWLNMYAAPNDLPYWWFDRLAADNGATDGRIALLHVWTDADGDHAEVIRCD